MAAAANNPEFAKKAGISQSTAKEYHDKDKKSGMLGKKKKKGYSMVRY